MTDKPDKKGGPRGPGSFCIPKAALNALLDNNATTYEICAYLVLACFTDESGRFSVANIKAVNRYTEANKTKGGTIDRAIERLKTIRVKSSRSVSNGRIGESHAMEEVVTDLGPILYGRDAWLAETGEILLDGPVAYSKVLNVLPDFDEGPADKVWFDKTLVMGYGGFKLPLKKLKNAGDLAARLLLSMYAANDMETWGGIRPVGSERGPWKHYEPVGGDVDLHGGARLIRAKDSGPVGPIEKWVTGTGENGTDKYWQALEALQSVGLVYEVVLVLNRDAIKANTGVSGREYSSIPADAEPLYELDCRSQHGYKPKGEEGIGWATANTAGALGHSVALEGGKFDGTYAAIVHKGFGAMIAGIYRLRFRVRNDKNAGVKEARARIYENNEDALKLVNRIRAANKLEPVEPPINGDDKPRVRLRELRGTTDGWMKDLF